MDSRAIEDQAAAWLVRRDSAEWSEADATQLAQWLEASTANRVAFLRLEVGWEQSERLAALRSPEQPGTVPPRGAWRVSPFFERRGAATASARHRALRARRPLIALAASILVAVGIGAYLLIAQNAGRYTTPIGGTASIPLRDGSSITLNTASSVRVAVTDRQRRVELERGEAFFEVARDPERPFVVIAGDKRIVAVGTRFSVRRGDGEIRVVVTEGKVRFESADTPFSANRAGEGAAAPMLTAGAVARASNAAVLVETKPVQRAEEILSWRSGYLTFDETTLADAVVEFNRYSSRKIYIEDPGVAALRINGRFRATNAEAFIRVIHEGFGIQARESEDRIVLTAH